MESKNGFFLWLEGVFFVALRRGSRSEAKAVLRTLRWLGLLFVALRRAFASLRSASLLPDYRPRWGQNKGRGPGPLSRDSALRAAPWASLGPRQHCAKWGQTGALAHYTGELVRPSGRGRESAGVNSRTSHNESPQILSRPPELAGPQRSPGRKAG